MIKSKHRTKICRSEDKTLRNERHIFRNVTKKCCLVHPATLNHSSRLFTQNIVTGDKSSQNRATKNSAKVTETVTASEATPELSSLEELSS